MGINLHGSFGPIHVSAPVGRYGVESAKGLAWGAAQFLKWGTIALSFPVLLTYWLVKGGVKDAIAAVPADRRGFEAPTLTPRGRRVVAWAVCVLVAATSLSQFARLEVASGLALAVVASGIALYAHRTVVESA